MKEIHGIVEIQRQAWKMPDLEIVPTFEMKAVTSFGIVLVAIDQTDTPIGFIYALPKFPDIHYSHMMATLPSWQGKGVGFELKKFHRNLAIRSENKINSIIWTVDPLLTNNAFLNFAKLGGICKTYYPNYYGDPELIGIYKGLPTDRFLLEWFINSDRVNRRMEDYTQDRISFEELSEKVELINSINEKGDFQLESQIPDERAFGVEVPGDFQNLRENNLELAFSWRIKFREICQSSFNKNYYISDFHSYLISGERRNFYEFTRVDT